MNERTIGANKKTGKIPARPRASLYFQNAINVIKQLHPNWCERSERKGRRDSQRESERERKRKKFGGVGWSPRKHSTPPTGSGIDRSAPLSPLPFPVYHRWIVLLQLPLVAHINTLTSRENVIETPTNCFRLHYFFTALFFFNNWINTEPPLRFAWLI